MTRLFRYILTVDIGMAPCIDRGVLTLATCKPSIRASAVAGDWVIGFRPRPEDRGHVAWAGRVAEVLDVGDYEQAHRGRSDAVYRKRPDGGFDRLRPDYHPGEAEMLRDVSAPVLVFDAAATWYFGAAPRALPPGLIHLAAGGRGHRVTGTRPTDAADLLRWLRGLSPAGVYGVPRDAPRTSVPVDAAPRAVGGMSVSPGARRAAGAARLASRGGCR